MKLKRAWVGGQAACLALVLALLAACASAPKPPATADASLGPWTGRMGLQVADKPEASFSAMFELSGNSRRGELLLTSPIGGTLGLLQWEPGHAVLKADSRTTEYDSVDALVAQATGARIPVGALFDWLRGIATPVPGWKPELSQLAQGRIAAKRYDPPPEADLRIVLDR